MKIAIIGLGHVGSTIAYTLLGQKEISDIFLYDKQEDKLQAEYQDLRDGLILSEYPEKNIVLNDYSALGSADILIYCPGDIKVLEHESDRLAELRVTSKITREIAPKISKSGFSGLIISITNPCDVIAGYLKGLLDYPAHKIIGSGTVLDTNRLRNALIDADYGASKGMIIGEHGETQVAVIDLDLSKSQKDELLSKSRYGGWSIFNVKKYTAFGIAPSVLYILKTIWNETGQPLPVSTYDSKEDVFYSYPTILSREGVVSKVDFPLMNDLSYKEELKKSIERIRENKDTI